MIAVAGAQRLLLPEPRVRHASVRVQITVGVQLRE